SLQVPGLAHLLVLEPAPADPFSIRTLATTEVGRFDPAALPGRRVKLQGTVTLSLAGQEFFLQDPAGGIRVRSAQTNELHLGDRVEVLGFPAIGDFTPRLEEAIFRQNGSGPLPTPVPSTAQEILVQGV